MAGTRKAGAGPSSPSSPTSRTSPTRQQAPALDVDTLIDDAGTGIVVCCGAGGVGKTTTAAAIALRAAEAGRRVVVLTIDPARRLAQALGLAELDNTPRPVTGFDEAADGTLDAMMLDMKRTFDDVVHAHSSPQKAEQILANPVYQRLSSSFAGTQEYMAMERLGQLRAQAEAEGTWDLIVVDTPPSRSALDFLDAPKRLGSFLDGRFIRLLMAPARLGGRAYLKVFSGSVTLAGQVMSKLLGAQLLTDVQTFVAAMDTMFGGFRQRADQTYALLQEEGTHFLVVAAPERDALREAAYFVERLADEDMPLAGLVVNRVQQTRANLSASRALAAAEALSEQDGQDGQDGQDDQHEANGPDDGWRPVDTAAVLRSHADRMQTAARHRALVRGFTAGYPRIPVVQVPAAAQDIHSIDALRDIGEALVPTR